MSDSSTIDRRQFTRVGFHAKVTLTRDDLSFDTHILDISLKGVLLARPPEYTLEAIQPEFIHIALADQTLIHMQVERIHQSEEVLGFKCKRIDMESMTHLRRIIELNMDDPNAPERVLSELINPI